MTFEVCRVIEKDHPALAGHFPGNPIVPGALILDEVVQAAGVWRGPVRVTRIISAKFVSPLEPGVEFCINLSEAGDSRIDFECSLEGQVVAAGRLVVESRLDVP